MPESIEDTLKDRGKKYGSFRAHAELSQKLKALVAGHNNKERTKYTVSMREALSMILHKIARIANGDPKHIDSWHDIAGYATLVVNELTEDAAKQECPHPEDHPGSPCPAPGAVWPQAPEVCSIVACTKPLGHSGLHTDAGGLTWNNDDPLILCPDPACVRPPRNHPKDHIDAAGRTWLVLEKQNDDTFIPCTQPTCTLSLDHIPGHINKDGRIWLTPKAAPRCLKAPCIRVLGHSGDHKDPDDFQEYNHE